MKKYLFLIASIATVVACSNSDNSEPEDPISSKVYTPLKSIEDLPEGKYQYIGNDLGSGKVGIAKKASGTCKERDYILIYKKTSQKIDSILYYSHTPVISQFNDLECPLVSNVPRVLRMNNLLAAGILKTNITEDFYEFFGADENSGSTRELRRKGIYSGNIEIGEQAGYLRIEDRLSNFKYGTQTASKPYLYFKKM
ncbi:hypothetical protein [Myroides phaeus]|uniref:Lipoprotein n=1 Tax=Myroides phaeus TaxID=702745 RepID=A0A1G8FTQ7_9FLAO|nr:hypothetical protein [Myroides phaeus]MEC4116445.1 hypothetical protein [Myroides phaeus]SDH85533.1 hypothetical protein SAMN05421818_11924 [Myroides phaeus]